MGHRLVHLARRFFGSFSPVPLDAEDRAWIEAHLTSGEVSLWNRMDRADRKHAAQVARATDAALGGADAPVIAAAALHDVGKVVARFSPVPRAVATVLVAAMGRARLATWAGDLDEAVAIGSGQTASSLSYKRRLGCYVHHEEIGARMLARAGSDPLTVAWAREHFLPAEEWTVPARIGDALAAADAD